MFSSEILAKIFRTYEGQTETDVSIHYNNIINFDTSINYARVVIGVNLSQGKLKIVRVSRVFELPKFELAESK